jgi:ERF superfamily
MHRSSESIAALAAALAKAQCELANPEKSLVARIGGDRPGEGIRSFRYAPLSSGLDIVRKALGQQQIATVQTTAIDGASGTVNLTTVLAHASGEWIASDWPVCRLADTAAPHRMGAALTYARRYALFTLVGIAGEDDLDAPDLTGGPRASAGGHGNIVPPAASSQPPQASRQTARAPILDPVNSAALRDRLVHEIASLASAEMAARWARTALPAKNTLLAADARLVQVAFELRLSDLGEVGTGTAELQSSPTAADDRGISAPAQGLRAASEPSGPTAGLVRGRSGRGRSTGGIDKSVLTLPEVRRYRDKAHVNFVASRACLVCGRQPCDPHHLLFAQVTALGRKVSDEFTVPLCRLHHRELHRSRNEPLWWKKFGIDPIKIAAQLWARTRAVRPAAAPPPTGQPPAIASLPPSRATNETAGPASPRKPSRKQSARRTASGGPSPQSSAPGLPAP